MTRPTRKPLSLAAAILLAASPLFAQAGAAGSLQRIGAAAAVGGKVSATAPNAKVGRVVQSGKPIFLNDHVTTDAKGRLQVLLLDQTVFTLGPDSDMVLDEYVYNPDDNSGSMTASVAKGAFRFVSGKISHESGKNMQIRTPSGTMGIRGTIAVGEVGPGGSTLILAGPGANNNAGEPPGRIEITAGGQTVGIDQPGYGTTVAGGGPPSPPRDMSGQLTQISNQVGAPAGGGSSSGGKQQASSGGGTTTGGTASGGTGTQGPNNATAAAGQDTASGGQTASVVVDQQSQTSDAAEVATIASQDFTRAGGINGISTWDQILAGITTGLDQYTMSGTYSCGGGSCGSGTTGTATMNLVIDWAARTIGSNGSNVNLQSSGGFSGDNASIGSQAFPATTGPATFPISNFGSASNLGTFSATVNLLNANGVIAHDANATISYSGSTGETASATTSGSRAPFSSPP
jgi:hypothetical protein